MVWQLPDPDTLKGKRDRAILAVLLGSGLRRRELTELTDEHFQRREDHWTIVDLIGKGGHVRTVPVPTWVKQTVARNPNEHMACHGCPVASLPVG